MLLTKFLAGSHTLHAERLYYSTVSDRRTFILVSSHVVTKTENFPCFRKWNDAFHLEGVRQHPSQKTCRVRVQSITISQHVLPQLRRREIEENSFLGFPCCISNLSLKLVFMTNWDAFTHKQLWAISCSPN